MEKINLNIGESIDNTMLCKIFGCSSQGGMRRSKKTNTLVLITKKSNSPYTDYWEGDILHYTGMGQQGDQSLTFMQNRTLAESNSNGIALHLFEYSQKQYTYCGIVKLVQEPYRSVQKDITGTDRTVYIFPLKRCVE